MRTVLSMSVLAILLMAVFSSTAFGLATVRWTGKGGNDLWHNPNNWEPNRVPGNEDEVVIDAPDAVQPRFTAESTQPKPVVFVAVGYYGKGGGLTIEGGKLECNCGLVGVKAKKKGRWELLNAPVAKATMNMKGGTLKMLGVSTFGDPVCKGGMMQVGRPNADATFNMSGGEIELGTLQIPASDVNSIGVFNFDGGVINVTMASDNETGLFIGENYDRDKKFNGVMNITGGKLILEGDATAIINKYINETKVLVPYPGKDAASYNKYVVVDYDVRNAGKTTVTAAASELKAAYKPGPIDGSAFADKAAALSWSAGKDAAKHNVYFGTDKEAVKSATDVNKEPGKGQIAEAAFKPGELAMGTYYWRVDEVDGSGGVTKGEVWSLTVAEKPKKAEAPKTAEPTEKSSEE